MTSFPPFIFFSVLAVLASFLFVSVHFPAITHRRGGPAGLPGQRAEWGMTGMGEGAQVLALAPAPAVPGTDLSRESRLLKTGRVTSPRVCAAAGRWQLRSWATPWPL